MTVPSSDPSGAGEPRPRPQYGEYASPEEQRARMKLPPPPVAPPAQTPMAPAVPPPPMWGAPSPPAPRAGHPVDRVGTIALLAYGAVNVVVSMFSFFDLPAATTAMYRVLGITGDFTNVDAARGWGIAAAVVLLLGYVGTALLAVRTLRRGRISWWIPLVGAVVTYAVVYICIAVPLLGDPAFMQYVTSR